MKRTVATLAVIPLVLALAACGVGTGPRATEERDVGEVSAVQLATSGNLTVERGDEPGLTVTAGEDVLDELTSEVVDGVLVLGVQGRSRWGSTGSIDYRLVVRSLESVTVRGSGDVRGDGVTGERVAVTVDGSGDVDLTGLEAREVAVAVAGSGDVRLSGSAREQHVSVDGSGEYRADDLESESAVVSVRGSGDVDVQVTGSLDVTVEGSGSVTHHGGAAVTSVVRGSGDIREG